MLDKTKHKIVLIQILKEIYSDPELRNILGFKGGTAIFLFYDLPRFSVDLDFNLLAEDKKTLVFQKLKTILAHFGEVIEAIEKKYTLFFLLSYKKGERTIKVEISKRPSTSRFELKSYLGIPIFVMKQEDIAAEKLSAILTRKKFAARDLFDVWFMLKNHWGITEKVVAEKTGFTLAAALEKAIEKVKTVHKNQLLQGLGELLDEEQKRFIKEKLCDELIFLLLLFQQEHQSLIN